MRIIPGTVYLIQEYGIENSHRGLIVIVIVDNKAKFELTMESVYE
jgi:hypothetical protein